MPWSVQLAAGAEADIADIAAWTVNQFGARQAEIYIATLFSGLRPLTEGPDVLGTRPLPNLAPHLHLLLVPRTRHVLVFRADHVNRRIQILRILHAAMDPSLHLPPDP